MVLGAPAVAMAVNLYARANAAANRSGTITVEANIPLKTLGRSSPNRRVDLRKVLEPLRLAAQDTLDHIGKRKLGISLEVDCEVPVGAGLGSSAATTVSIITAVAEAGSIHLAKKDTFKIAFGPESYLHGNPSGVDHAASINGGIIRFTKPDQVSKIAVTAAPRLLVCDTGIHRSTGNLVVGVVRKSKRKKKLYTARVEEVKRISESAIRAIKRGDSQDLGELMNANHSLLVEIGVSHPALDRLVKVARANGALGAKMTGAGGGGCMVALCETATNEPSISRALRRAGGIPYTVSMDSEGARAVRGGQSSNRLLLKGVSESF